MAAGASGDRGRLVLLSRGGACGGSFVRTVSPLSGKVRIFASMPEQTSSLPALTFSGLTTGYRRARREYVVGRALAGTLCAGDFIVLAGRNGCGKSTLLRTLAGFLPPLGGRLLLQGRERAAYSPRELAVTVAVVLTQRPDTPYLTAEETVAVGRMPYTRLTGRLTEADRQIITDALRQTRTTHLAHRPLSSLSDGECQRIMIAKALAQQTPIILLDEPTAYLDHPSKRELLGLLRTLAQVHRKAVLVSTHDLELAARYATRAWLMTEEGLAKKEADALLKLC